MYKVSDLLGKPLLSLCEAKFLGTICDIYFDDKMQKGNFLKLFDDEDEECFLPIGKLLGINNDAAVVRNAEGVVSEIEGLKNPINSFAFNQDGKSLGQIKDVIMDGSKVCSFLIGESTVGSANLISAGTLLVFNDSGKSLKLKTQKKEKQNPPPTKKEVVFPAKTAFAPSYDFLLGKKLQRTIAAGNGKVIAREGENITGAIIENAKKEGKLVILALNAL